MYKTAYAQEAGSSATLMRDREHEVFQQSIELLERADAGEGGKMAVTEALVFARRLWTVLLEDLSRDENSLPEETRANFISIGLWVLRECEDISLRKSNNFKGLIDVSRSIQDGLK
ncbi:MAG: flagellar biosynthesis regulator FlaF [Hyphomicrobiaceae bacterium]